MPTAIVSLSEFKAKAAQMLAEMKSAEHEIVLTQRGAASAVVQDFETHQRHRNALLMLKLIAQGEAAVDPSNGATAGFSVALRGNMPDRTRQAAPRMSRNCRIRANIRLRTRISRVLPPR